MKKLVYGGGLFLLIAAGFVACKKENISQFSENVHTKSYTIDTISGLEKIGGILRFRTIQDYVDFVEDSLDAKWSRLELFTTNTGFQNYFTQHPLNGDITDSLAMDEHFGKLLNADGVVIIGEYGIKVDLTKQVVFVTAENNLAENYNDLINGNDSNKAIKGFSTDDDVIDLLIEGVSFKCGGSSEFNVPSGIFEEDFDLIGKEYVRFRARYFKAGIYFSVRVKGYHYPDPNTGLYNSDPNLQFEIRSDNPNWKAMRMRPRPCSGSNNVYHGGGLRNFTGNGVWSNDIFGRYKTWKGYERVKGLNGYRVWIRGYINGQLSSSTWIGREVNSSF
jgi:hypothetical protein